jgi:hypothetical protein
MIDEWTSRRLGEKCSPVDELRQWFDIQPLMTSRITADLEGGYIQPRVPRN